MIKRIFGFLGYVKISKEAITLSMSIENMTKVQMEVFKGVKMTTEALKHQLDAQKSLTEYLRICRRITWREK